MKYVRRKPVFLISNLVGCTASRQQKMVRGLKFRISEVEGLYYLCNENKVADQQRGYIFAYAKSMSSHEGAQNILWQDFYSKFGQCRITELISTK